MGESPNPTTVKVTEHPEGWAVLEIDNPPVNLVDHNVYRELVEHVERFEADPGVRVVVIQSADPDFFSAHFDISLTPEQLDEANELYPRLIKALRSPQLVSIAKIRGRARSGGHELTLLADLRFAAKENALIAQTELGSGIIPGGGALQLLPGLIGRARTLELVLTGTDIDAETAERYGVVNQALPDAELDEYVAKLAARIASRDPKAVGATKEAVYRRHAPSYEDLETDQKLFRGMLDNPALRDRVEQLLKAGFQSRGPVEYNLGAWR